MKKYCVKQVKRILPLFRQVLNYMGQRHVATIAGASAFWFFLSIVPMVILITSLLPYTGVPRELLFSSVANYVPASMQELLNTVVTDVYDSSLAVLSVSLLTTLWSAAMGFSALIRGLEEIYEQPERAGYLRRRARAMVHLLIFIAALILALLFMGLGRSVQLFLETHFPLTHGFFFLLTKLRFGGVQIVLVLLFASVYRWAPGLPLRFADQLPGAVFSALGWTLFSAAFSFWISLTNGYGTYGSLATVAVVMVWMYYCITIILWGGCLNKAISRLRS